MKVRRALVAIALVVAACAEATPNTTPRPTPTARPATETPAPSDFFATAAEGAWRPRPLPPPAGFVDRIDATCRAAEPAIGAVRRAVVDLRGQGRLILVFGDATTGFACFASTEAALATDVHAFALDVPQKPIDESAIDVIRYEIVRGQNDEPYSVLIGRVGGLAYRVLAGFDDESEVEGAKGGGWYAMWWPGTAQFNGVGAVDLRNLVIGSAPAERPATP